MISIEDYNGDLGYISSRISDTVVMHNSIPVYVHEIKDDYTVSLTNLLTSEPYRAPISELDISPFKMGYVNKNKNCIFTSRKPVRYYKQGFNNVHLKGNTNISDKNFIKSLANIYPDKILCLEEIICEECTSKAFNRDWAFKKSKKMFGDCVNLLFRGDLVGYVKYNGNFNFQLHPQYNFLGQMMEKIL